MKPTIYVIAKPQGGWRVEIKTHPEGVVHWQRLASTAGYLQIVLTRAAAERKRMLQLKKK